MICAAACLLVTVTLVWDGDTFRRTEGPRIRLWGMNAPALDEPGGPEAREALDRIINGQPLVCERKGTSHDRIVARCETPDGTDLSCAMIRGGWGMEAVKFSKAAYRGCKP